MLTNIDKLQVLHFTYPFIALYLQTGYSTFDNGSFFSVPAIRELICRGCGCKRPKERFKDGWDNRNRICFVCLKAARRAKKKRTRLHFSHEINLLIESGDVGIINLTNFANHLCDAIGGIQNLPVVIDEFLEHTPQPCGVAAQREQIISSNRWHLVSALLVTLAGLEDARVRELEVNDVIKKSMADWSKEELAGQVIQFAIPMLQKNPQLAVKSLEAAGYTVTLERTKEKKQ